MNPYITGNSVGDSRAFIGRADVLREVQKILRNHNSNAIVLFGQRRIGKTSVLEHLGTWLPNEGAYCPVYFDLQDKADLPLDRVLEDLSQTIARALNQPKPDLGSDPVATFRDRWLPAILDDLPENCSLVLLFDEFDVLADPHGEQAAKAFFPYLRGLLASDPRRLQFVFVIGRNVDDLDNIALSLFKGTTYRRVSLLNREDTIDLVRMSQANNTLRWPDDTVERVWQLTHGHPFLTQQLCSHVWERVCDDNLSQPPAVTLADVDTVIPDALEASRNTMEWLWGGLGSAERVVTSALAEAGPGPITEEALEHLLHESGIRVVIRELQKAPRLLQEWDILEPTSGGYRFRVELLRRWIADYKPLNRVQDELDYIEPMAENLYQVGLGYFQSKDLIRAINALREAIELNPSHMRTNLLLSSILLTQGQTNEARQLLERLYVYQPAAARPRLIQAYLNQAQDTESNDEKLSLYEKVLELDPLQPEATTGKRHIWQRRGDTALEANDWDKALRAYQMAGNDDKVIEIEQEKRRRDLNAQQAKLEALEQEGRYQEALEQIHLLSTEYPRVKNWTPDLERLERKVNLPNLYRRALEALQNGDQKTAKNLLLQVINLDADYKEATSYLHWAVKGRDVAEPQTPSKTHKSSRNPLHHLRLLWWTLGTPRRLRAYQKTRENDRYKMGMWLASTLIWLPFFILALALGLETLPRAEMVYSPLIYQLLITGLILTWLLTGWLGEWNNSSAVTIAVAMAFALTALMANGVTVFEAGGVAIALAIIVVCGTVLAVVTIITDAMPFSVMGSAAFGIVVGATSTAAFGVVGNIENKAVFIATVAIATLVAITLVFSIAFTVTNDVKKHIATGHFPWLARGSLGALMLAQVFLIWFSFLGGWRMFQ